MKSIELGSEVAITVSGEKGVVIGMARYLHSETQCLVRYVAADGRATETWWYESALTP